ncbi:MAG: N-acetylmuramoyl-L-alanine amidase, partial [Deltaproteobacteria bacterium]|nr:N-acetylmuramoyl-L-alanine amidase [Deltaproteobacteria bacterium]
MFFFYSAAAVSSPVRAYVTGIKHWSNPAYTRISITLSRKAAYSHRLLKKDPSINKPRRLYIDIKDSSLVKRLDKTIEINDGLLKTVRAGQHDKDTVRVVLDIESIEDYKVFPLSDPFRIVIDVNGEKTSKARPGPAVDSGPGGKGAPAGTPAANEAGVKEAPAARTGAGKRPFNIVIDPGHGGKDPGAIGKKGLKEKDVTLRISRLLKERLSARLKSRIIATRETDVFIPLEERTAIANSKDADIFVSIHVNASPKSTASGVGTY